MGCRILHDHDQDLAALYCSTTGVAFGPVFGDSDVDPFPDAYERAEAFLRWLPMDPRVLDDGTLQLKYSEWLAQEQDQQKREHPELCDGCGEPVGTCDAYCPAVLAKGGRV